ncbi:MAG: carbohydrate binding domain-containing protein, partial [Patescibacteria group bacterium]|nr:carbohydrate binding domain-containing protein [Patescibacteria group bacterium]
MYLNKNTKKLSIVSLLIVFLFVFNFNFLCAPKTAHAQVVVDPTNLAAKIANFVWDKVNWVYTKVYKDIVSIAFKKGLQTYMNMLAQEAAKSVVGGGPGQKALWTTDGWKDFNKKAGDAAGASFIDQISKGIASSTGVFIDVCEPPGGLDVKLGMQLKLSKYSLSGSSPLAEPRCSLDDMKKKWGSLADKLRDDPSSLVKLNGNSLAQLTGDSSSYAAMNFVKDMVKVKESDIQYVNMTELSFAQFAEEAKKIAELNRINPDSAKPATAIITGGIKKPAQVSEEDLAAIRAETKKVSEISTGSMAADTANIFLNTLVSEGLNKLVQRLFESLAPQPEYTPLISEEDQPYGDYSINTIKGPLDVINRIFESISRISYNLTAKDIDIITELETDMGDDIISSLNNGSIDSEFAQLLRKAQSGDGLSLKEAVDANYLKKDRFFGFIDINSSASVREPSLEEGYSYTSMQKLRKARIIPVGWELAATYIYEMGQSQKIPEGCSSMGCTLDNVISQFDKKGHYYKDGNSTTPVLDKYCGWRPLSSDPYFINKDNKTECESFGNSNDLNIQTKWDGGNATSKGYCYKYETDSNGVINNITDMTSSNPSESACIYSGPFETVYYEWKDGGCMVKELDESELCGLVDPNWIMRAPIQQCRLEGYYSALEMTESSNRYTDCADTAHCLKEDDFGNCIGGYDYCLKEKNIWRFKGDQCNSEFNTCTTLVDDKKESKSYLTNTLKSCPQEEVGCREYLKDKSCDESGICSWDEESNPIYFNSNVETCDYSNDSCNKLIEVKQRVNFVPNGSFEIDEETEGFYGYQRPDGWLYETDWQNSLGGLKDDGALSGSKYFKYDNDGVNNPSNWLWMPIQLPTGGLYTLSYSVRGNGAVSVNLKFCENEGTCPSGTNPLIYVSNSDLSFSGNTNNEWERKSGYLYITKDMAKNSQNAHVILTGLSGNVDIDSVQLELNSFSEINNYCTRNGNYFNCDGEGDPSSYIEYGSSNNKYIKTAPSYYSCDTNPNKPECSGYAKQCSFENVGCASYYPELKGIVSMIPAVISENDKCPSACNGFDTFSEFPGYFDKMEATENNVEVFPIDNNFIPNSATDCPRSEESCELFTNLDKLEKGGESKEYYNRIRQCVKPEEAEITLYYTWEGSDTEAYQLKTWKVLKSNIVDSYSADGYAPCTNVTIGGTNCLDNGSNVVECDPSSDLDCRTFYDENAIAHNRLLSKTIPITDECIDLRREESDDKIVYKIAPSLSRKCSAKNVGCTKYDGNNAGNVRNLLEEGFESGSINGWDASSGSLDTHKAPSSESVYYNGQSMKVAIEGGTASSMSVMNLTYNSGSINVMPGKKYILSFWAKTFSGNSVSDFFGGTSEDQFLYNNIFNKAKAQSGNQILDFNQSITVDNEDWALYEVSIISPESININSSSLTLKFAVAINNTTYNIDGIYIDNIVLKEIQSSFYKIKDSWNTPKVCFGEDNPDENGSAVPYLGCQRYTDKDNIPVYLYEFSNLCKEEYVGCKAMIDTHNSDMPFQQTFNAYCENETNSYGKECNIGKYYYKNNSYVIPSNITTSTVVVPKDDIVYIVDDDKYSCSSSNKGCGSLGVSDDSSTYYDTYLINNPDNYISSDKYGSSDKQILCLDEYKNCVAFTKPDNSKIYKIHPRGLECEYKDVDLVHNIKAGFYTKDGVDCSYLLYNENYDNLSYNLADSWKPFLGDYIYNNEYAAVCDKESSGCSEFIDPLDNKNMRDYVATNLGDNLNFSSASQWTKAFWDIEDSSISLSTGAIASLTDPDRGNILDYQISQSGSDKLNMLAYKHTEVSNLYNFFVNSGDIYRLGAWVKFDGNMATGTESVITFLNCRQNPNSFTNFFEGSSTPFAFPYMSSKSYIREDVSENGWHYIYGLYKVMSSANYCSVAFYVDGVVGSHILFDDINFDKVEGDYYYINNDNLDDSSCSYPSLKEGCVLFNNTADSNLSWNANESYVNNVLSPGDDYKSSDTNKLLKVTRDRECGEWSTCGSQTKTFDERSGQVKSSCISLIACDEVSDNGNSCSHPFKRNSDIKPLTLDSYRQDRGSYSWSDLDLSGYSIPGLYPIDTLSPIKTTTTSDYSLGHIIVKNTANNNNFVYKMGIGIKNPLSSPFNPSVLSNSQSKSCRLYPEADSPFPWTEINNMVTDISTSTDSYVIPKTVSANFKNANVCQPNFNFVDIDGPHKIIDNNDNCDCHYTKAVYGSQTLYYPYDESNIIGTIPDSINTPYETNVAIGSKTKHIGLKGYCLEYDKSYAINNTRGDNAEYRCLSWYPVEMLSGEIDSFSMAESADINQFVPLDAKLCAIADDWKTPEDRVYCGVFGAGGCNVLIFVPAGSTVNT